MPQSDLLLMREVVDLLRISRQAVYWLQRHKSFPRGVKLGNHVRFPRASVLAWLAARERKPAAHRAA